MKLERLDDNRFYFESWPESYSHEDLRKMLAEIGKHEKIECGTLPNGKMFWMVKP